MSTKTIDVPAGQWIQVYTGPTASPLAVESYVQPFNLYINGAVPTANIGHLATPGRIKNVTLDAGENLYAFGVVSGVLIITD